MKYVLYCTSEYLKQGEYHNLAITYFHHLAIALPPPSCNLLPLSLPAITFFWFVISFYPFNSPHISFDPSLTLLSHAVLLIYSYVDAVTIVPESLWVLDLRPKACGLVLLSILYHICHGNSRGIKVILSLLVYFR